MDNRGKKNLKIRPGLHHRLRVFSLATGRSIEDLADHILESGLTDILAAAPNRDMAAAAVAFIDAGNPTEVTPPKPPKKGAKLPKKGIKKRAKR